MLNKCYAIKYMLTENDISSYKQNQNFDSHVLYSMTLKDQRVLYWRCET